MQEAIILPFRHSNRFGQSEIAELTRWSAKAAQVLWFLQEDLDPLTRSSHWIACTEDGDEYISVAHGSSGGSLDFMVAPLNGRWQLFDHKGMLIRTFGSLRDTLEAICPTLQHRLDSIKSRSVA